MRIFFLIAFFLFCVPEARAEVLSSENEAWLSLVHYRPKSFGGYESTVDSETFFLSPEGKTNPQAELEATIALFNSGDDEKKCLFPARYKLLKSHGVDVGKYPKCKDYEEFYQDLHPAGVTLLFTNAYMNNPSSLFGHTLLRIDTGRKGTQLLAHGANYGAFTAGQENSVLFAVLGLTGGYYGGFTVKPYYDIINTYNNIENRDIWEFNLDFTPEELDFFVAHLWEIGHTQTRYYFFTQNCSYMLMETLDAVRPSLHLSDEFPVQTIPLDTIKAVVSRPGLIKSVNYRPSRQAKIIYRVSQMNDTQYDAFLEAVKHQNWSLEGLNDDEKADVLETAYQYIQYQYVAKDLELGDYRKRSFKALTTRNKIEVKEYFEELKEGKSPAEAHDSMRASVGFGVHNGDGFQEISYRPAYNSLTDDSYGMLSGAEINFLNVSARHYDRRDNYVLQNFDLVGIKSLFPFNDMFFPFSYNIEAGIQREMNPQTEEEGYVFNLVVGGGVSHNITDNLLLYTLVNNHLAYGGFVPHNQWAGLGFVGGIYGNWGKVRLLAEAEKVLATSHFADKMKYKIEAAYGLSRNTAIALNYTYHQNYGHDLDETMISLRQHF